MEPKPNFCLIYFEGVCLTHDILASGACGRVALSWGVWLTKAGKAGKAAKAGKADAGSEFRGTPNPMIPFGAV